ncbi:LPXTG cell wall anchor domain-containing protein [Arthrobacter sp. NPDC057009]|uniref:LPXTG cell wall anchor domain-containing protein n=1 Tax=Arthrobacter sp. NPDC057009 TaxID=3345996 RepID=UPI00363A3F45
MKKTLAILAIAASLAGAGVTAANAYVTPETATVSDPVVAPGETFIFSGSGMNSNERVDVVASNEGGPAAAGGSTGIGAASVPTGVIVLSAVVNLSTTADASGRFSVPVALTEPGTYTVTGTGATSGTRVSAVVTVTATGDLGGGTGTGTGTGLANTGGDALANTGTDASLLLWGAAGIAALGLGAGGVILARRRVKLEA